MKLKDWLHDQQQDEPTNEDELKNETDIRKNDAP